MEQLSKAEHKHRLAYATRQFLVFQAKVILNTTLASISLQSGELGKANEYAKRTNRFIHLMIEANDTIDEHSRAIGKADE